MKHLGDLLGESPGIEAVRDKIVRLLERQHDARRLPPVLIEGETGTGKGLLARLIHRAGPRPDGPFVDVNCAAIPETLLEAEMFGFERGAFTDARRAKPGLFQAANRGTIFLDEVGLLSEGLQAKLLKVLEERSVRRLGSTRDEPIDAWILTATNEDLRAAIHARRFREDLYHRLAVLTLTLPPLRQRGNDILRLADHFLGRACADYSVSPKTLTADARAALRAYSWPGNVRELGNLMERVVLLSSEPEVTAEALGLPSEAVAAPSAPVPAGAASSLDDAVRDRVADVLRSTNWNISRTASLLGISRNTLRARIEKYGLRSGAAPAPTSARRAEPRRTRSAAAPPAVQSPAPAPPAPTAPVSLRWERRRVAFLRGILSPIDPEAPLEASRALDAFIEKIESFGGTLEGVSPAGAIAAFGLDVMEDAVDRAAHGATAILKATERAQREGGTRVAVKLGIHVGQVLVGLGGGGGEIALEARQTLWPLLDELVRPAEPNAIVVSGAAAPFLRRRFELLPGATPTSYRLAGRDRVGLDPGGRLTRFVGRTHELELLRSRLEPAKRGQGQIVGVGGDAGIGKSRLVLEFRQGLDMPPGAFLEGHCHSYGVSMPYLPALDFLRSMCGLTDSDLPEVTAEKIRLGLTAVGMDPDPTPYLLQGLGVREAVGSPAPLSPEAFKARIFGTLRQMILRRSREALLVIVLEDLHWIDRTSEEFFASLAEHVAGSRILMVSTYRSGYRPPWLEKSYATQIALQPLAPEDCVSLMQSVLPTREVAAPIARLILDKAEGNPFFIEELARAAAEHEDPLPGLGVPETVQDVLLARIERLSDAPRRLLQAASVLGREAPLLLLRAVWDGPEELDGPLLELGSLEFLYETSGAEETIYVFRHSLTQEVAYETLAPSRRQSLHEVVGHALEALYADRLEEACDRLAHHYGRTKDDDKAIRYLAMAADRSARGYAHAEAVEALRAARDRVERLAPTSAREQQVLDLVLREAHSLHVLGRFEEVLELLVRQKERVGGLDDMARAAAYHFWLGRTYSVLSDHERTVPSIHRAIELARAANDEATLGKSAFILAFEDYWSGELARGVEHGSEAVAWLDRTGERWWLGMAHWVVALNHMLLGDFESSFEAVARADAIGEAMGDLRLRNYAAWTSGWINASRGEVEAAVDACQRSREQSQDPVNTAYALGHLGHAYLEKGEPKLAIPPLTQAIEELTKFNPGFRPTRARFMVSLSEAYLAAGQIDVATRLAAESLEVSRGVRFRYAVGLAQRAAGKAAQASGDLDGAGRWFDEALEIFEAMRARFEMARTQIALAELAHARGDLPSAARHLREADRAFRSLRVPRHEEHAARLARAWAVNL